MSWGQLSGHWRLGLGLPPFQQMAEWCPKPYQRPLQAVLTTCTGLWMERESPKEQPRRAEGSAWAFPKGEVPALPLGEDWSLLTSDDVGIRAACQHLLPECVSPSPRGEQWPQENRMIHGSNARGLPSREGVTTPWQEALVCLPEIPVGPGEMLWGRPGMCMEVAGGAPVPTP